MSLILIVNVLENEVWRRVGTLLIHHASLIFFTCLSLVLWGVSVVTAAVARKLPLFVFQLFLSFSFIKFCGLDQVLICIKYTKRLTNWRPSVRVNYIVCVTHLFRLFFPGRGGMRGRGGFLGRGRGRGRGREAGRPVVTREQLDNQLDAYMSKTKGHLDAELDAYMAQADPESMEWSASVYTDLLSARHIVTGIVLTSDLNKINAIYRELSTKVTICVLRAGCTVRF